MRKVPILLLMLLGSKVYTGPISGDVRNDKFSFSHSSDWNSNQIVNVVQNDHTASLVVFWPEGGITAPEERPIPPKKSDSNKSFCPEDRLGNNLSAQLFYGLSHTAKTAGVYKIAQAALKSEVMKSEVVASTVGEPIRLEVVSTAIRNEFVEYRFVENRPLYLALPIQSSLFKYFEAARVPVLSNAFQAVTFGKLPLRQQIAGLDAYALLKPLDQDSLVKIPTTSFQIRRLLVFLVDREMKLLASGFVSLHFPTPKP